MRRADNLHVPIVLKSGSLNLVQPSGPVLACNRTAFTTTTTVGGSSSNRRTTLATSALWSVVLQTPQPIFRYFHAVVQCDTAPCRTDYVGRHAVKVLSWRRATPRCGWSMYIVMYSQIAPSGTWLVRQGYYPCHMNHVAKGDTWQQGYRDFVEFAFRETVIERAAGAITR